MEEKETQRGISRKQETPWSESLPPASKKPKVKSVERKNPFENFMKKNYAEHFRRIKAWRRSARWVLVVYPVLTGLAFAAPFYVLRKVAAELYRAQPPWFAEFMNPETQSFVLPLLTALSGVAIFLGIVMGLGLGISRSRILNFEAERTELLVQQNYYLRRMVAHKKWKRKRTGSY
ncbi:MAG: hypothetical protein RIR26_1971 [Pseudomonadota bacterium]|jgi:hypothetical protein